MRPCNAWHVKTPVWLSARYAPVCCAPGLPAYVHTCQKRPVPPCQQPLPPARLAKETCVYHKRDLRVRQKRPACLAKERRMHDAERACAAPASPAQVRPLVGQTACRSDPLSVVCPAAALGLRVLHSCAPCLTLVVCVSRDWVSSLGMRHAVRHTVAGAQGQ